jgi:hypothetical protein
MKNVALYAAIISLTFSIDAIDFVLLVFRDETTLFSGRQRS